MAQIFVIYVPPMAFILIVSIQIIAYIFLFFGGKLLQKNLIDFYCSNWFKIVSVIGIIAQILMVIITIVQFTNRTVYINYYIIITLIITAIRIVFFGILFIWIGYKNENYFGRYIEISGVFYIAFSTGYNIIFFYYFLIVKSFDLIEFKIFIALLSSLFLVSCLYFLFFALKINEKNFKISTVISLMLSINSTLSAFVAIYYFIAYNA